MATGKPTARPARIRYPKEGKARAEVSTGRAEPSATGAAAEVLAQLEKGTDVVIAAMAD